ncbi:MAG: thiamine diphosphokinase, partial [Eubacteriales bacterium]|nr:thiamine diphosphokinase [Eubacteriales bacterium]
MKALIIGNGQILDTSIITKNLNENDIIICCDGGTKYAFEEGILPNYILGDLDSSLPQIIQFFEQKGVEFKKFPTKKDETDMELCINFAISLKVTEILIFGAIGTRFDHSLANASILMQALKSNVFAKIINENNEIVLIDNEIEIIGEKGDLISLLPLSTNVTGVTTEGLEYPLNDYTMEIGKALGISNVMLCEKAKVYIKSGYLFV